MGRKIHFTFPADNTSVDRLEQLLVERAVEITGEEPTRLRRQNSVSIDPRNFDYEISRDDLELVNDLPIYRCFGTYFGDTAMAGGARVYEQLGETFVELEHRLEHVIPPRYYQPDYLRVNYGVDPAFYLYEGSHGTIEREDGEEEWSSIRNWRDSDGVSEYQLARWFNSATRQGVEFGDLDDDDRSERTDLSIETVRMALDDDAAYHVVAVILNRLADGLHPMVVQNGATEEEVSRVSKAVVRDLAAADDQTRRKAVRHVAAVGTLNDEVYHSFLEAFRETDDRTRLLVASKLWTPGPADAEATPDPSLVEALLSLTDDPVPEVRIGAFVGAGRILGRLLHDISAGEVSESVLEGLAQTFYESHLPLLDDDDTRVREVTRRSVFRCLYEETGVMFADGLWERVDLELRWEVATAVAALEHDDDPAKILYDEPDKIVVSVFGSLSEYSESKPLAKVDPEDIGDGLVDRVARYAYRPDTPGRSGARKILTELAHRRPETVVDAIGRVLDDEAVGSETLWESFVEAAVDHLLDLVSNQARDVSYDLVSRRLLAAARASRSATEAAVLRHYDTVEALATHFGDGTGDELQARLEESGS